MLRATVFALIALTTTPALAESPPEPECPCHSGWICRESEQICYPEESVCTTSADCRSGTICDRNRGEDAFPGLCVIRPFVCTADTDCAGLGELCSRSAARQIECADGDETCAAALGLGCGRPALCGEPDDPPCFGDTVCVHSRCMPPELVALAEEIEADADMIEAYRAAEFDALPLYDTEESCTAVPGQGTGSGVALLGLLCALGVRRVGRR